MFPIEIIENVIVPVYVIGVKGLVEFHVGHDSVAVCVSSICERVTVLGVNIRNIRDIRVDIRDIRDIREDIRILEMLGWIKGMLEMLEMLGMLGTISVYVSVYLQKCLREDGRREEGGWHQCDGVVAIAMVLMRLLIVIMVMMVVMKMKSPKRGKISSQKN